MSSELFAPDNYQPPYEKLSFDALPPQEWPEQLDPTKRHGNLHLVGEEPANVYRVGAPFLPVAPYRNYFVNTVAENQYSVWSSETGSGKSSQLGLYLLEAGVPKVYITQPRILAARELFERALFSLGPDYMHLTGYETGDSSDSDCNPDAKIIYITEQLLFKRANRGEISPWDAVINDEAHERTVGTVALLGLMKEITADDPTIRLLISSATIDTQKFSNYLIDPRTGNPAPVSVLPGRTHPIKDEFRDEFVHDVAKEYMKKGNNVLAFEPGESRMRYTATQMGLRNKGHSVHVLYGDQSPTQQAKALNPEDGNHIVSTRIGETSITPQGKDTVIDSGLSNIGLYEQGVRVLKTVFSSRATMEQRRGRVGRTKPGNYVVAIPSDAPTPPAFKDRDAFDPPAMETSSVASYVNELLLKNRRLEKMDLIEYPTHENLSHDYKVLQRLGAIAIRDGQPVLTDIGRAMTDLKADASWARMMVEARTIDQIYEVDSTAVRLQVAAIAAIYQVNGILAAGPKSERRFLSSKRGGDNFSNDHSSDVLFSLDTFIRAGQKYQRLLESEPDKATERFEHFLEQKDVRVNRYIKALKTFEELCRREKLDPAQLTIPTAEERKAIVGCQISGADELFVQRTKTFHYDIRGNDKRSLGNKSTISPDLARLVVGTPFDYRGLSAAGRFNKSYISGGSAVTKEQLLRHAPHRITSKNLGYIVDKDGNFMQREALYFDGELQFFEDSVLPEPTIQTREFILRAMMTGVATRMVSQQPKQASYDSKTLNASNAIKQWERAQKLDHKSAANLMTSERYNKLINKIVRDSVNQIPLDVTDPELLDEVIPPVFLNSLVRPTRKKDIPEIIRQSPDAITLQVEDEKTYLAVSYRHNIAYITVPRGLEYNISAEDIADVVKYHPVKLRVGNGQYSQSEAFFKQMVERQEAPKRLKRLEKRAEQAATESTPESFAQAVDRVKALRKKVLKPKQIDSVNVSNITTKKQAHRQRRSHEKSKEQVDQKTVQGR